MKIKLDDKGNVVVQDGKVVYVYDDGKEVAFDAVSTVAKINGLNGEAKAHRERAEAAETKLKSFEGIADPEIARKALETIKNIDDKKLVDAGKVEEVRAAAVKAYEDKLVAANQTHAEQMAKLHVDLERANGDLHSEKIGGSFNRSKLITEKFAIPADLVQARFGSAFKIEEGKIVAKDNAGNKIFSRSRPGDLADFDEALEILVDQYPYKDQILKGSGATGSGATGGNQGASGKKTIPRSQFDAMDAGSRATAMRDGATVTD
ncbi:DUF6651 domain-containing protein [Solimicrobium silvestre]|uniref:DUF6651 domain-containing protein n=1 Tax=Solimicrobium silvestre TaxID=2099400 RepID=A0A2S9GY67_9BURK|nr:DUF6651 domain-containing protein [Solimicrobium silvestre]PRC92667.1 hypothetical protein S2091_2722 [Solimicrobium silvestre]